MDRESPRKRCSVLVVEDNPDIREMLCELVESECGCKAYPAEHGREALDILATLPSPPSLILVDLMMPVMDGYEVIEALTNHEVYGDVVITVITATPEASPKTSGGILRKPFEPDAVRALLHMHCSVARNKK
jgi:CheY-like chemotaxis protein